MKEINDQILDKNIRKAESHKGQNGKVLVVAGSSDFTGAAVLTSLACEAILRSGADLVVACCPKQVGWMVNNYLPDAIVKKYNTEYFTEKHADEIVSQLNEFDSLLIGPGLSEQSDKFIKKIIGQTNIPKVIDATAIKSTDLAEVDNAIFTPHQKEFEILLTNSNLNEDNFRDHLNNNVVLLKGAEDKIFSQNQQAKNITGNSVMTKGGTGDVLAGLAAGFAAQGYSLFESACKAAYINGAVGDYLQEKMGITFIASDLVKNIHQVYN
jgi:NAD(P)H-hydrate epimerase